MVFTPRAFLARLAVLVPRPRVNLVLYHGVLAPRAAWRAEVVPRTGSEAVVSSAALADESAAPSSRGWRWADLMRRVFAADVLACSRCGGRLRLVATLEASAITRRMESITALKDGLRDLGHVEGKDYVLDIRIADNDPNRYPEPIRELTQLRVKLIVAASTPAAVAIHKANPTMPIVVRGPDIVGAGLAKSASRPGGVATGIEELTPGNSDKRLLLLKQAVPAIAHVAVLSSAPTDSGHAAVYAEVEPTAKAIGVTLPSNQSLRHDQL